MTTVTTAVTLVRRVLATALMTSWLVACGGSASLDSSDSLPPVDDAVSDDAVDVESVPLSPEQSTTATNPEPEPESEPAPEPEPAPEIAVFTEQSDSDQVEGTPAVPANDAATIDLTATGPVVVSTPVDGPFQLGDITDLVLLTGQSNALGAGTDFDRWLDAPNERVFAYTDQGWQIADLSQVWDLGWHPGNDGSEPPSNNLALHFGKSMAQMTGDDRVFGFVLATAPGRAISHWRRDGDFYQSIDLKVRAALSEHPGKTTLDGILWHQGESDAEGGAEYGEELQTLIENFRSESWFDDGKPFICGETARFAVNEQLMALNHDDDPWTGCIAAAGLPTHTDGAHFLAEALRIMGQRYAQIYNQMWWQAPR